MPMTEEKLLSAFEACWDILRKNGVRGPERNPDANLLTERLKHLLWLAENGPNLVYEGRREKAMRWLGFLQGGLWGLNLADIDDLKGMNKPEGTDHDKERI